MSDHQGGIIQPLISAVWIFAALFVPVYRTLPPGAGRIWTYSVLGLGVITLVAGRGGHPKWPAIWVIAGYGAVAAGISSSGSSGLGATLPEGIQMFVVLGLLPFALRGSVEQDPKLLLRGSAAFLGTQTLSAIAGVAQLVGIPVLGYAAQYGRSPGLAGHPNILGVMSAIAVLVCTHALANKVPIRRSWIVIVLAVNALGLVSTGSLSSMFACFFGILFVMSVNRIKIRYLFWSVIAGVLAIWALLQIPVVNEFFRNPLDRFFQVTGQTDDISTLGIRLLTYEAAWTRIQIDPFLGKGLDPESAGSFGATLVHNIWLHAWYNGGLLLAIGIGAILIGALIFVVQAARARQHGLAAGVVVTVLTYAMTSAMFGQAYYWLPVLAAWASIPTTRVTSRASGISNEDS
jgi:O-antigen ligase